MNLTPEQLVPGAVIGLEDATQLHAFEDMVAQQVNTLRSTLGQTMWNGRPKLTDILRPPKFNGRMADILCGIMVDPVESLETARDRGWQFQKPTGMGSVEQVRKITEVNEKGKAIGFTFLANAKSTGRGTIGQVQAELWYMPANESFGGLTSVHRIVTKPKMETKKFIELVETSRMIGETVFSDAIKATRPNAFYY